MESELHSLATDWTADIVPGTLSMLILKTLASRMMHGAAIAASLHAASGGALRVQEGALYPALHKLKLKNWVAVEPGFSEHRRHAKFYRLTAEGATALSAEHARWIRMTGAIARILETPN